MESQRKVLIVEDDDYLLNKYAEILVSAGYQVDKSKNLSEALRQIDVKTYHVALVDLQLDENSRKSDGLKVLKRFHELDEGTKTIVCSAQSSPNVVVEAYEQYGVDKYIVKPNNEGEPIRSDGFIKKGGLVPDQIINPVNTAFSNCLIRHYGDAGLAARFLAGPENLDGWVFRCLTELGPADGAAGLYSFLLEFLEPLTPLMPDKSAATPVRIEEGELHGDFWSKGIGVAVSISISRAGAAVRGDDRALVREFEKARVLGLAYELRGRERSEFIGTLTA